MIGFMLEFGKKYNIEIKVINLSHSEDWILLYREKYDFIYDDKLPSKDELKSFLFVLVLTDGDDKFSYNLIDDDTICVDHFYKSYSNIIKYHIPITIFDDRSIGYTLPSFNYISYEDKVSLLLKNEKPIITILGNSSYPHDFLKLQLLIKNIDEFDIQIINRKIYEVPKIKNVKTFENINPKLMFELLSISTYLLFVPNFTIGAIEQMNLQRITASLPLSFTTGCKLIMPSKMNQNLRLKSIITYNNDQIELDLNPSLIDTFEERNIIIENSNRTILNLPHMNGIRNEVKNKDINIFVLCYNEAILIPHMVSHYRKYLPSCKITIYDNESDDNSVEIARSLDCEVISWTSGGILDEIKQTNIKNNCWKSLKDGWIIMIDMDEFLCVTEEQLNEEHKIGNNILSIKGLQMIGESLTDDLSDLDLQDIKKYLPCSQMNKNLCFYRGDIDDMNYSIGEHNCSPIGLNIKFSDEEYLNKHMSSPGLTFSIERIKTRYERSVKMRSIGISYHYTDDVNRITSDYENNLRICQILS